MDKARIFAKLPYPLKMVVAAARGYYLERWRYDATTEARIAAAIERESWSAERWKSYEEERLVRLLVHAAKEVPYYREQWSERRRHGDHSSVEELQNWPVLSKEPLRRNARAFLADSAARHKLFRESTSGSSGTPVALFWDQETSLSWYALFEARCRRWHGVTRQDTWAILGGQSIAAVDRRHPPFWVYNRAMRQLYLSSSHLAPDLIPFYLEAMRRHQVRYLYGYSSALDTLASFGQGHAELGLEVVLSNAEPLYQHQRERITRAFGCPVRETWGMAELVAAAGECQAGHLHLWPEVGVVELENEDGQIGRAQSGAGGDVIATGLLNFAQPLVRYRLGDRLTFAAPEPCPCGRRLPILAAVEGRSDDMVITEDGRRLGRLDPIFKGDLPISEAQIVQETRQRLRLRYVPAPGFDAATKEELRRRFRQRVGNLELVFEKVQALERTRNGKLKGVVSLLPHPLPSPPHPGGVPQSSRWLRPSSGATTGRDVPSAGATTRDEASPAATGAVLASSGTDESATPPLLSVIVPVRNEEAYIEQGLEALLRQSLGSASFEILLVDGRSQDKTLTQARKMLSGHQKLSWKILDNPGLTAPCAMNVGLAAARGDFIARVDGHCELEERYFEKAIHLLGQHPRAAGVAGRLETLGQGLKASVIAAAMSSSFGVGGAAFRLPGAPGSLVEADTVAFAVYRRQALEENGAFDEELVRNQDDEYNFRLRKKGWTLLLAAELQAKYYSRGTFLKLFRQYFEYGIYKVRVMQKHPLQMSPRHFVPLLFVLALIATGAMLPFSKLPLLALLALWLSAALMASFALVRREGWSAGQAPARILLLPWAFFLLHTGYGLGFARGLLRFGGGFLGRRRDVETP